jgi:transaldolase
METNSLRQLAGLGQSVWMDYIRRDLMESGELKRRIDLGLTGLTSNPAIFEKAITGSHLYDDAVRFLAREGKAPQDIYGELSRLDIRHAADAFAPVYQQTNGADGYVSLEVNPHLARDTQGTVEEARRLWREVDRPNLLVKVPATGEGLLAIRQLIQEGISVNVTLIFGRARYVQVADAYLEGMEARLNQGLPLARVFSVASLFVSRFDVMADPLLDAVKAPYTEKAAAVRGQVAIAEAKLAYQIYKGILASRRFKELAAAGAQPQRLLWASTSTKDPKESDVKYVEALIGRDTITTLTPATFDAYLDHGRPQARLEEGLDAARTLLVALPSWGITPTELEQRLEEEGVEKFTRPYDKLMQALEALSR